MKKIAVINDISGFGKCSLTAAIPIISAHKMQCCPLVSGVFSNQTGYESYKYADMTEHMQGFIDDFKKENTLVVVDPVMADDGEIYKGFDEKRIAAVCSLAKKADIITPNISELCILCNESLEDIKGEKALEKVEKMAQSFAKENNCCVVVSGIEISPSEIATAVFDKTEFVVIKNRRVGESFSGTGDILCSYLTCELLGGMNLFAAVEEACSFIERALIKTANKNGLNPTDGIDF
ncbi:MAG: bifunctional hydroxymethylpyrimidine kinase/phosphomethylpyrimidine kinase, partial [Eubacterium sp.]|nr:bifunctional hydroxymethylpyrimidine kinase/phosphomethylpyrimidine kinase [Eubacterium sp.]